MSLSVDISGTYEAFHLSAAFQTGSGVTALFGPSGSGKTSLMEAIGGLRQPQRGQVSLNGITLFDRDKGINIPTHRRRIGWVFQESRLFPHLTGRQNLFYGQVFTPRAERRADFEGIVDLLGLDHLLDRRPDHYSGGEKSRVAIGRALMASPRFLMMDEPLAALDEARKAEIIPYIERLKSEGGIGILYVTHSIAEVVRLANQVVLMAGGQVVASGPTSEVFARFDLGGALGEADAGAIIDTRIVGHEPRHQLTKLAAKSGELFVAAMNLPIGETVRLRIKARDVLIALDRPTGISALNALAGTIVRLGRGQGPNVNIELDCNGDRLLAQLTAKSAEMLGLTEGRAIYAIIKSVSFDRLR